MVPGPQVKRALLALVLLLACKPELSPLVPYAKRFEPTSLHRKQYARAEECLGIKGDFGRIRWYVADGLETAEGLPAWGLWMVNHETYLDSTKLNDPGVILHESLHDVKSVIDHPPVPCCTGTDWAVCA